MKRFSIVVMLLLILGSVLGAMFITQNAGLVGAALKELKFEALPANPQMVGAPPQFKVTNDTLNFLKKLGQENKIIEVQNDGSLKVK
jgi:hypothetical protein